MEKRRKIQEKSCLQPLYLGMELKELQKGYKLIEYGDLKVAVSCEVEFEHVEYDGFEIYSPGSYLLYVVQGSVKIDHEHASHHFPQGSFCLVRKYTNIRYSQTAVEDGGRPKTYKFALGDGFIKKIISEIKFEKDLKPIGDRVLSLKGTQALNDVVFSIKGFLEDGKPLEGHQLQLAVEQALKAIVAADPKLAIIFKEFSRAERADLNKFMEGSFLMKVPMEDLAELSGRSLSTFNRDFKMIFDTTPHQWILRKRLHLAHFFLSQTEKTVSDVAFETGFEDVAHFSRSFKKEFGIPPSEVRAISGQQEKIGYLS